MKRVAILALMLAVFSMAVNFASAKDPEFVLKFGHLANEENPWHKSALEFAQIVKKKTGGAVEVQVFPNSQLGKEMDLIRGMQMGTADFTITGESMQNWAPLAALLAAPYAVRDLDHLKKIINSKANEKIAQQIIDKVKVRPVATFGRGPRNLTSNRPITKPSDLNGMILRVPNVPLFVSFWEAAGAKPTPMAFSEVFTSLQQGTIEGQENPLALIKSASFYEVQKYVNLTEHVTGWIYVAMSERKFQKLPKEYQDAILEAGKIVSEHAMDNLVKEEEEYKQFLEAKGMKFVEVDKAEFQKIAAKAVKENFSPEQYALYEEIVNIK